VDVASGYRRTLREHRPAPKAHDEARSKKAVFEGGPFKHVALLAKEYENPWLKGTWEKSKNPAVNGEDFLGSGNPFGAFTGAPYPYFVAE
jgi:hypothetical protein